MGLRVRDFSSVHPSADGSYTLVLAELERQVNRLDELARQQQGGVFTRHGSVARRKVERRRIHAELLRHLVTVAALAAEDHRELVGRFVLPDGKLPSEAYRTYARKLLEEGQANRELLAKYGLADRLLDDLAAALDAFDRSVADTNEGLRAHVGARAELKAVSDEIMRLVAMLDGLNRYRFSGNAEMLAAWESAKRVVSGPNGAGRAPESPDVPPADGGVRPAA
jgi:hypothetical protein